MTREAIFNAFCYEIGLLVASQWPSFAFKPWFKMLMAYCRPSWIEWKTQNTLKAVDAQIKELVEQWKEEGRGIRSQDLASKAQELFPEATITPFPNAPVPSVMIVREAPADSSDAVKALGAELRITYSLD